MAKKMKAAVVREFGKPLVIEEVAIPEPGPEEIQIKMEACGVCHTDLHAAEGDWPIKPTPPSSLDTRVSGMSPALAGTSRR